MQYPKCRNCILPELRRPARVLQKQPEISRGRPNTKLHPAFRAMDRITARCIESMETRKRIVANYPLPAAHRLADYQRAAHALCDQGGTSTRMPNRVYYACIDR